MHVVEAAVVRASIRGKKCRRSLLRSGSMKLGCAEGLQLTDQQLRIICNKGIILVALGLMASIV